MILVARVFGGANAGFGADSLQFLAAPAEKRPHEGDIAPGHRRRAAHAGEAANARATGQAHDDRLRLIVELMPGDDRVEAALLRPFAEESITLRAGAFLERRIR